MVHIILCKGHTFNVYGWTDFSQKIIIFRFTDYTQSKFHFCLQSRYRQQRPSMWYLIWNIQRHVG